MSFHQLYVQSIFENAAIKSGRFVTKVVIHPADCPVSFFKLLAKHCPQINELELRVSVMRAEIFGHIVKLPLVHLKLLTGYRVGVAPNGLLLRIIR